MILGPAGFGLGAQVLVNIPGFMPLTGSRKTIQTEKDHAPVVSQYLRNIHLLENDCQLVHI